jgi:hypothetical protein
MVSFFRMNSGPEDQAISERPEQLKKEYSQ